jgi:tetratricopeptide (TPR) repeat protein
MRVLQMVVLSLAALFLSGFVGTAQTDPSTASRQVIQHLIESGHVQEAQDRLKEEVSAHGESPETIFLEGLILFKQKQYEKSLQKAEHSLALGLRETEVYKLVAFNGIVLNRLETVEPALKAALKLAPDDFVLHFHLGLLYFTTNRFAMAESQFQKVIELNPSYMKAYDMLGQAQEEVEKEDTALETYHKAIELTNQQSLSDESAYLHLAKLLWVKNRYSESLAPAQKAVELNPKSAEAYYVLGRLLDKLGKGTEAEKLLRRATQIDPNYGEPYYLLSRIYLKEARQKEAVEALETFKSVTGNRRQKNDEIPSRLQ